MLVSIHQDKRLIETVEVTVPGETEAIKAVLEGRAPLRAVLQPSKSYRISCGASSASAYGDELAVSAGLIGAAKDEVQPATGRLSCTVPNTGNGPKGRLYDRNCKHPLVDHDCKVPVPPITPIDDVKKLARQIHRDATVHVDPTRWTETHAPDGDIEVELEYYDGNYAPDVFRNGGFVEYDGKRMCVTEAVVNVDRTILRGHLVMKCKPVFNGSIEILGSLKPIDWSKFP